MCYCWTYDYFIITYYYFQVNIYSIAELKVGRADTPTLVSVESKELHEKVVLKPLEVNENNETIGGECDNEAMTTNDKIDYSDCSFTRPLAQTYVIRPSAQTYVIRPSAQTYVIRLSAQASLYNKTFIPSFCN